MVAEHSRKMGPNGPSVSLEFSTTHEVYFSNREPIPIKQVAETLLALDRIIRMTPQVLEGLTQIEIHGIDVYVDTIESGSLLEKVFIKLFFKTEEELDAFLDKIGEKIRQPGMPRNVLIGTVIAALVGYGAWLAAKVSSQPGQTHVNAFNNTIINLGAGQVDMTPEAFRAIVETAVRDKKELAQNAVKLIQPARSEKDAKIVFDGSETITLTAAAVREVPLKLEFDKQEFVENLSDVDLQIRATDRDSPNRGWAAVLPGKIERRVKLKLDPSVKTADVADKFQVRGDVSVHYKMDKSQKKMVPDHIVLREVIKN